MKPLIKILLSLTIVMPMMTMAQEMDNLRQKVLTVDNDTILLDTLSIIPETLVITDSQGRVLDSTKYSFEAASSMLILRQADYTMLSGKELKVDYRVFPYNFSRKYQNKDASFIKPRTEEPYNPFIYQYEQKESDFMRFSNLSKSGSISRGISFGNSQDLVVNSNLNLQLSGKLSKDIDVVAAITDNTVPIQPEGNTQQIQEFDRVYIQLGIKKNTLVVGDFELTRPKSYFMNVYEKAQGGLFNTEFQVGDKENSKISGTNKIRFAAALGKGKYSINRIQGAEGNQGPYKLTGNQGETNIIVLAGSERVYIDGLPLVRGEANDYVVDYNLGEITFTPNILIDKDSRITVEFEYSDKNYAQALFYFMDEFNSDKFNLRFNFYSKSDLKNQPIQQDLTNDEKTLLSQVGDSLMNAVVLNLDSTGYATDQIRYKIIDTLVNGQYFDTVFVYSTNPDSALYQVGFSLVGEGRGNYVLDQTAANGRVFRWVAPVNGEPQGKYSPVRLLVTPKKSQMITLGGDYQLNKRTRLTSELALSNQDLNTFSASGNEDDVGFAGKLGLQNEKEFGNGKAGPWVMRTGLNYEFNSRDFTYLEPFRPVEFTRDWNAQADQSGAQHLGSVNIGFLNNSVGKVNYELESYFIGDNYKGVRNNLAFSLGHQKYAANFKGSILNSGDTANNTIFARSIGDISRRFKWFTIGLTEDQEYNVYRSAENDSLVPTSYSYFKWGAFIRSPDTSNTRINLNYTRRSDRLPAGSELKLATLAEGIKFSLALQKNRNNRFNITASYRNLIIKDTLLSMNDPDRSIVGRLEHFLKLKKGLLSSSIFYELGTGQEEKLEVSYLKVADGEGYYTWVDYNNDGVQQINEFEVAPFKDQANYIRLFTSTNEFIRSYFNQFSTSILINPAAVWVNEKGIKRFIARLSNQLAYRTEHKSADDSPNMAFNPFISNEKIRDSLLLSLSSNFRNTLYFDRNSSKFSLDLTFQNNRGKVLLNSGFESRTVRVRGLNLRWNFYKAFSILFAYEYDKKERFSEFFSLRDYDLRGHRVNPRLSYQPGAQLRIDLKYDYAVALNVYQGDDTRSRINDYGIELSYKLANKGSFLVQANYLSVFFNGNTSTPLAFELLEGYQPGDNGTWSVSYQQTIARHLQLNLQYNGRKSPDTPIVHVGSVQLRAYF